MDRKSWQLLLMAGLIACFGVSGAEAVKPGSVAVEGTFGARTADGFTLNTTEATVTVIETAATKYKGFSDLYDLVAGDLLKVTGVEDSGTGDITATRIELLEDADPVEPDPPMPINLYWVTGSVEEFTAYEMVDYWYWWNEEQDVWVIRYLPAAEPKVLKIITATEDSAEDADDDGINDWEVHTGDKYILDFGPDWFASLDCLEDSYVCPCKPANQSPCYVKVGPFDLGYFLCDGNLVDSVLTNDHNTYPALDTYIELMSGDQRDTLWLEYPEGGADAYAFGRAGGSEIVWLFECIEGDEIDPYDDGTGCDIGEYYLLTDLYPTLEDSNIVWEMQLPAGSDNVWWRAEGAPYVKVSELGCTITE